MSASIAENINFPTHLDFIITDASDNLRQTALILVQLSYLEKQIDPNSKMDSAKRQPKDFKKGTAKDRKKS